MMSKDRQSQIALVIVIPTGPDDGINPADRDGYAEVVFRRAVVGQDFEDLLACGGIEQVRRAGIGAVVADTVGSDDGGVSTNRYGDAEMVIHRSVAGIKLGDLLARCGVEEVREPE